MQSNISRLGITEITGTLILLLITISIFGIVNIMVFSFDTPNHNASYGIIGYVNENKVILEHRGGPQINLDQISVILTIDNTEYTLNPTNDFVLKNQNDNGDTELWEISEILVYTSDSILNKNVNVKIIDIEYNSVVMMGKLQKTDETNNLPSIPSEPSGTTSGNTGVSYSYSTNSTDPDGDVIKYGWDWDGDNNVDEWTSFYTSGSTATTSHSWGSANTYQVKVKAMDINGGQSTFSTVLTVVISGSVNNPPDAPSDSVPVNNSVDIGTSPTLYVNVSDTDGDSMDVTFYNSSDDSVIGTDTSVVSGGTASTTWSGLSYSTVYSWYAIADDGSDTTQSATWSFTTETGSIWDTLTYDDFESGSQFSSSNY